MTFLNRDLEEEVYMKKPKRFSSSNGEHLVCKLKKSIYGLKQTSHQWYLKHHDIISSFGFVENIMDQCIYQKISGSKICSLQQIWAIAITPIARTTDVSSLNDSSMRKFLLGPYSEDICPKCPCYRVRRKINHVKF